MNQKDIRTFRQLLMTWYADNKREFPWRKETPEPFVTLVSEVMLQQTQTSRVAEKLPLFLEKFPTIQRLATATNSEVIRAWQGMGYNSRALRLRDCARSIVDKYDGEIPSTKHELLELIGIGNYTASALLAFCFKQNVAVVDVNIRRVYSRIASKMTTTSMLLPVKEIDELAEKIFPRGESSMWHQAVMDIGSSFCTARKPKCKECPLGSVCLSSGEMVDVPPVKRSEPSRYGVPRRIWRGELSSCYVRHMVLYQFRKLQIICLVLLRLPMIPIGFIHLLFNWKKRGYVLFI
ncbi:MAG: A/G-specific adenine glycosylase [Ignavibacteria bacterium]|nr:A/G-specific adenine glycosylase [Ignavibacteria bacterium]